MLFVLSDIRRFGAVGFAFTNQVRNPPLECSDCRPRFSHTRGLNSPPFEVRGRSVLGSVVSGVEDGTVHRDCCASAAPIVVNTGLAIDTVSRLPQDQRTVTRQSSGLLKVF